MNIYQQHHSKGDPYQLDPRLREPWLARLALLKPTAGNWIVGVQLWHFFWLYIYIYYIQYIIIYIYCTYIYIHTVYFIFASCGRPAIHQAFGRPHDSKYLPWLLSWGPRIFPFWEIHKTTGESARDIFSFFFGGWYDTIPLLLGNYMICIHYDWGIIRYFLGFSKSKSRKISKVWSEVTILFFLLGCWSKTTANFPFLNDIQRARTFGRPHFQTARYVGNTRSLRRLNLKLAYHLTLPF